jgi:hypothetical protein
MSFFAFLYCCELSLSISFLPFITVLLFFNRASRADIFQLFEQQNQRDVVAIAESNIEDTILIFGKIPFNQVDNPESRRLIQIITSQWKFYDHPSQKPPPPIKQ